MKQKCDKKKFSREDSLTALDEATKSNNPERKEKRVYYCSQCRAYHLTSVGYGVHEKYQKMKREAREKRIERYAKYWSEKLGIK